LQDAREYLQRLGRKRNNCCVDPNKKIEPVGVKISPSLSGETVNESVSSSHDCTSSLGMIRKSCYGIMDSKAGVKIEDVHVTFATEIDKNRQVTEKTNVNRDHVTYREEIIEIKKLSDSPGAIAMAEKEIKATCKGNNETISVVDQTTSDRTICCSAVEVTECGIPEINGRYHRFESSDGVPAYSKIESYEGKEAIFTIGRWNSNTGVKKWRITAAVPGGMDLCTKQLAFYVAFAPSFVLHPPKKNWMIEEGGDLFLPPEYEGRGVHPVPVITHESDANSGIPGMQVASTSSRKSRRRTVRSASTPRYTRSVRSVSTER